MLIENDNHYRTLYVVVRLSELDLKTWILMRLKKMKMVIVFILKNENGYHFHLWKKCGKKSKSVDNLKSRYGN